MIFARNSTIGLLLAYYGDDFTGSTDVLEALSTAGLESVLFVGLPSDALRRRYEHVRAIGIAGNSRTMSPDEMDRTLPETFEAIRKCEPQFVHYKVCSTFDSSPAIGSIGRAIDIGHKVFQSRVLPLVVGVPALRRYCVFGNLFARSGLNSAPFRLDRHPTMQRHPVTPMNEADLRVHLSKQTSRPIELVDVLDLDDGLVRVREALNRVQPSGAVVLFDTLSEQHLDTIGEAISDLQEQERKTLFCAGSSGVAYALVRHWQSSGIAPARKPTHRHLPEVSAANRVLVLSGSCSPVTGRQIGWALDHGFSEVAIDLTRLYSLNREAYICDIAKQATSALEDGRSVIIHTSSCTASSPATATNGAAAACTGVAPDLGDQLGRILCEVLRARLVRRLCVVGGDTSGQIARALGIEAVEMIGPLEPGAPLCVVRSGEPDIDGLEFAFKGGQVGYDDFFGTLLSGRSSHSLKGVQA